LFPGWNANYGYGSRATVALNGCVFQILFVALVITRSQINRDLGSAVDHEFAFCRFVAWAGILRTRETAIRT
jgi:hypothetical protein